MMTATQDVGWGELERLNAISVRRPTPQRDRWGRWHRDPGGEWDWFYTLPDDDRAYVRAHHLSPLGVMPDELATWLDTDVDTAMAQWLEAVQLTRRNRLALVDPLSDEWESSWYDDDVAQWLGPDEVAELLQVKRNTLAVWRHRGLLPEPTRVISSLPIWSRDVILEWARDTGREIVEAP